MVRVTKKPEKEVDAEKPRKKGTRKEKQRKRKPMTVTGPGCLFGTHAKTQPALAGNK